MKRYTFNPSDRVCGCLIWEDPLHELREVVRNDYQEFYNYRALRSINWKWLWKREVAKSKLVSILIG